MPANLEPIGLPDWDDTKYSPVELPTIEEIDNFFFDSFQAIYADGTKKLMVGASWCLRQKAPYTPDSPSYRKLVLGELGVGDRAVIDGIVRALDILHFKEEDNDPPIIQPFITLTNADVLLYGSQTEEELVSDPNQRFLVPLSPEGSTLYLYDVAA